MPDPFEALRTAPTPIDPDPAFAARLRARVSLALSPEGDQPMTLQTPQTAERLRQGDISYLALWVHDVPRAAAFYAPVLGWQLAPESGPYREIGGQSMAHGLTELRASADFMAAELGLPSGPVSGPTGFAVFVVDNLEAGIERVRAAGGRAGTPKQQPYGPVAACADDQGMLFSLHEVPADMPAPRPQTARQGDVAYLTFEVGDSARTRAFFGSVLGLQFSHGRIEDGWNIAGIAPMSGLSGGHAQTRIVPMYRVDDIGAAVERARALGGTATEPSREPYGLASNCTDDQGTRFDLGQF
jgi:predicted enzyme related to lactoylglutathione lyase